VIHFDTHALVWYLSASSRVGKRARARLERALARDELAVSSLVFWEAALLVDRGRLALGGTVDQFRRRVLETGIREAVVDGRIAISAARTAGALVDPVDCLIVATAASIGATVVTADARILRSGLVDVLNIRR
jgi:PIN domain nuclease of toxin-antitoxin system